MASGIKPPVCLTKRCYSTGTPGNLVAQTTKYSSSNALLPGVQQFLQKGLCPSYHFIICSAHKAGIPTSGKILTIQQKDICMLIIDGLYLYMRTMGRINMAFLVQLLIFFYFEDYIQASTAKWTTFLRGEIRISKKACILQLENDISGM